MQYPGAGNFSLERQGERIASGNPRPKESLAVRERPLTGAEAFSRERAIARQEERGKYISNSFSVCPLIPCQCLSSSKFNQKPGSLG